MKQGYKGYRATLGVNSLNGSAVPGKYFTFLFDIQTERGFDSKINSWLLFQKKESNSQIGVK